jgi:hypothetical protein
MGLRFMQGLMRTHGNKIYPIELLRLTRGAIAAMCPGYMWEFLEKLLSRFSGNIWM